MIKYLIMDIDGSLTDSKIYMGNDGETKPMELHIFRALQ